MYGGADPLRRRFSQPAVPVAGREDGRRGKQGADIVGKSRRGQREKYKDADDPGRGEPFELPWSRQARGERHGVRG